MAGIWVRAGPVSNHPRVPRGTNAPAHLGAPALVAYTTEFLSSHASWAQDMGPAVKTTTCPPGRTNCEPASIQASGGKVARDAATSKDPRGTSSWRHLATSKDAEVPRIRFAVARNAVLFARGSTNRVRQSGRSTENGTPGSPPPAPTSTTAADAGHSLAKANESGR